MEKALINAIAESVENFSASSVSRIAKELDEKVEEFLKRSIEHPIEYLFVEFEEI